MPPVIITVQQSISKGKDMKKREKKGKGQKCFLFLTDDEQYIKEMDDSITSAEENKKQKTNLFQEINKINTDEWRNQEFAFSPHASFHSSFDQQEDTSFSNDLPLQSKICQDLLELQDVLEVSHREAVQKTDSLKMQNKSQQPSPSPPLSSLPSQVTITLHEQSLASKFYEQNETQDDSNFSTSLRSFLNLNEKNYRPHVICLKFLFTKLKDHSRQSLQNLKLYIHFLEIKMKQETRSLKPLDDFAAQQQGPEEEDDDVNIDQKVLMELMKNQMNNRRTKRKAFYASIKQIYEDLLSTWRKIKEKRQKRERYIEQQIIRVIDRIELQMEDMIKCRLQNQRERADNKFISEKIKSQNPYLTKDKYLQMKYLIQRESAYLKLISEFNGKLITYMINMFSKEEVQITKNIQEALVDYSTAYMNCYDESNQILTLKIEKAEEAEAERRLKGELANMLLSFIPKELYDIGQNQHKFQHNSDKLQAILGDFSNYLQNTIFITTIQMNNEFILFRNEAVWKTSKSFFDKEEHCIDYESKQALANSKSIHNAHVPEYQPKNDAKIVVVLTSNYYLHLQNEDKIATVRLGDVKLSKRGRQVIIADKGKGIGGYFGMKTQLGRLQFETIEQVDIFAQKLSLALRRLAYV